MNKNQVIQKLRKIYEDIQSKEKIEIHLKNIDRIILQKEEALKSIDLKLLKEENDLKKLEKKSIYNLFNSILGKFEEKYEKEKQDFLQAHLMKEATIDGLNKLKKEKETLLRNYSSKFNSEVSFSQQLKILDKLLKQDYPETFEQITLFEKKITNYKAKIKELKQAMKEGQKTTRKLQRIVISMDKIKTWGKLNSRKSKTNHTRAMDKIQRDLHVCSNYLEKFEEEIFDLSDHYGLDFTNLVEGVRNFMNSFFDNLITDWIVNQKLENSLNYASNTSDKISRILSMLELEVNKTKNYIKEEQKLKRSFIINSIK